MQKAQTVYKKRMLREKVAHNKNVCLEIRLLLSKPVRFGWLGSSDMKSVLCTHY